MASPKLDINTSYKLLSGYSIPALGFGVYQTPASTTSACVTHALRTGYRHIDSARVYRNEQPCADAIRTTSLPPVPPKAMGYDATKNSIASSLSQTGLEYIDLYLVHAPYGGKEARRGTWRALVEAKERGEVRSLGVSNYGVHHLEELEGFIRELERERGGKKGSGGEISVGQWELHPWLTRPDIVGWCKSRGVVVEAYCPLVRNQRAGDEKLRALAKKHGKSTAQVLIRWSLQMGWVPLPKSENEGRITENAGVYNFELSEEEMEDLKTDRYEPCSWDPTTSHE
ncbi:MAG: hypothetical protein OHK93_001281 [Ramalina farinacea]|uniref:NADP-dependent oxidoreductase domain-containing protein n=1 Tax=Ramalina farinacea TaxID=258253 RepID=A0AA43TSQ0_9LECA|nr:hypothetical protein [Ramalina farinacea]